MMRTLAALLIFVCFAVQLLGQDRRIPRLVQPTAMPSDRAEDAYTIYSQLLTTGPIEWRDVKRAQWLIEDTTNGMPLDLPCRPASGADAAMNPHDAVKAPEDRQSEWNEVLADYDQHCHDVVQLDQGSFRTELPVRLLNAEDKQRYMGSLLQMPAEFADGAGLHQFSEVFFNADHTLALVEEGMLCGTLCGNWAWVALEHKEGRWQMLPWVCAAAIS